MSEFIMDGLWTNAYAEEDTAAAPETTETQGTVEGEEEGEGQVKSGGGITTIILMVAMVAVFYLLLIRPQRKKDKAVKNMLNALKVGDRICTIGGIYGTITAIKEDTVTLAIGGDKAPVVIARWAIRSVEDKATENDQQLSND